ncbi:unnamed protein product [Rotaria socialis]
MVYLWTFINDHQLLRRWLGAFSQLVIVIFLCISQQPLSGIDLVAMSYLIWSTIMTSSINEINKQGESTSVLINQQPQSYYAREDIAPVNASLTTSFRILWSSCLERYNQIIETTKFSMKSWHKRELNYRLPIDFSRQSTIV